KGRKKPLPRRLRRFAEKSYKTHVLSIPFCCPTWLPLRGELLFSGPLAFETNYRVEVYYPILILLALVFQISCAITRSAATLTDEKIIAKLGKSAYTLVDSSGAWTIRQVTSPRYSAEFRPSRETSPNLGYRRSAVWVRFT